MLLLNVSYTTYMLLHYYTVMHTQVYLYIMRVYMHMCEDSVRYRLQCKTIKKQIFAFSIPEIVLLSLIKMYVYRFPYL